MTPQGMLNPGTGSSTAGSANVYNQVSSAGLAGREQLAPEEEQQPQMESLVEKATKRFGAVFNQFVSLTESYPGSDKESEIVKNALANWFKATANKINESGGNSTY